MFVEHVLGQAGTCFAWSFTMLCCAPVLHSVLVLSLHMISHLLPLTPPQLAARNTAPEVVAASPQLHSLINHLIKNLSKLVQVFPVVDLAAI
jgi:hypothetical protein